MPDFKLQVAFWGQSDMAEAADVQIK